MELIGFQINTYSKNIIEQSLSKQYILKNKQNKKLKLHQIFYRMSKHINQDKHILLPTR